MKRNAQLSFLFGLCPVFLLALPAVAGPLFPCVKAVSSKNGNFLALTDVQPEPGQGNAQRVLLQVFPRENFINTKDRLAAPASYWTDWIRWSVMLDADRMRNEPQPCPLPLITDDGEFLILLHVGPTLSGEHAVLQIYRRRDHLGDPVREGPDHGVFIKSIALKQIWPSDKLADNTAAWDDETPQWFAGGTFEFSEDSRQLAHKTRWGNTVRINLEDGSVSWK
jgi:hypothetical protein